MKLQKKTNWGGQRKGAGRKKLENPKKTVMVRVDEALAPLVLELRAKYKTGIEIKNLIPVSENQDSLQYELEQWKERNLKLILERDKEHLQAVKLSGEILSLKSTVRSQKTEIEALKHKDYDCQLLTKNGNRCTRTARLKTDWHGVEINICLQHFKTLES